MSTVRAAAVMERLGIDRESFRALGLLPLVQVAWADGKIQMGERAAIRSFAAQKGWLGGGVEAILDGWLTRRPSEEDAEEGAAAFAALAAERRGLGASIPAGALDAVMRACRDVAAASGGLFGLKSAISREEDRALQRVCERLGLADGRSWREVCAEIDADLQDHEAPGSAGHFLVGKAPEMLSDPLSLVLDSWRRFGDVVKIDVGATCFHLVVHPDDLQHVLVDNSRNYERDEVAEGLERVFGDGLLTSDGEPWQSKRRRLEPGFHQQKLRGMAAAMVELTAGFVASLAAAAESGQPIDVAARMSDLALRIAGGALFHVETTGDAAAFQWALPILIQQVAERHLAIVNLPAFLPTAGNRRFKEALAAMDKVIYRAIAERRQSKEDPDDLLSLLLAARDEYTGKPLRDREVHDELALMIVAAHETTAGALAFTFAALSRHPAAAEEVREELRRELDGRAPTLSDLPRLAVTRQTIEESMRLWPPAWLLTRRAVAEDTLADHPIPAGSSVIIAPYLTHRHPKFWPNPEGFDPARFSPEAEKGRHPMAYLPFGAGPHQCLGAAFARMEMQIVLAMVLSAYELHLVPATEPQMSPALTLSPLDGFWMTVHRAE